MTIWTHAVPGSFVPEKWNLLRRDYKLMWFLLISAPLLILWMLLTAYFMSPYKNDEDPEVEIRGSESGGSESGDDDNTTLYLRPRPRIGPRFRGYAVVFPRQQ